MASSLNDGHTRFVAPESWESSVRLTPQFQYRTIRTESGTMIWDVSEGSNAEAAGLKPGDVIRSINGVSPQERERPAVIHDGEYALFEIERPGRGKLRLDVLPEPAGARPFEARMVGSVAYVLLHSFVSPSQKLDGEIPFEASFSTAVLNLAAVQPSGWVLDLRDCPGGSIAALGFVAGLFGVDGLVYEATQRSGSTRSVYASGEDAVQGKPLVVLVDGASASAAEVLTATLQDKGLAQVIGTATAKKVDGALRFPLDNGGGLVITFERARAGPLRRVLDGVGITPNELIALNTRDIVRGIDNQLARALAYIKEESAPLGSN
jgi:carboxyl-terminal processing protease